MSPRPASLSLHLASIVDTTAERPPARGTASGVRSGMVIAGASLAGTVLNYAFLLLAGRSIGAESYGALAALLGLLTVVLLPASALQLAVSREISHRVASGDEVRAEGFVHATARLAAILTLPLVCAGLILAYPMAQVLGISTGIVALTAVALVAALLVPVALGALQGFQRFTALAAMYAVPFALRLLLFIAVVAAGFRLGGAVFATVAATIASTIIVLLLVREPLGRGAKLARPALGPFLRYLGPVLLGLIGIAALTNLDVLVVKARFPSGDAGDYAAASAFAKVAFFLPATILSVLFPRTAARQARGEDTKDILGRSLLVTAAFGAVVTLFYAAAGRGLVVTTYGAAFFEGGKLTAPYAFAMGLYALANILVGYHLSRGETRYAWIVAATAPVQLVVLTLVPNTLADVVWANALVATALLVGHEVFVDTSVPALGAGFRHIAHGIRLARRTVVEALLVLVASTAFVCVLFRPLVAGIGTVVLGRGSDSVGTVYSLWQWHHESGYHLFGQTHHTLTGAPFGWDGDNGLNIQWLLPYYAGYLATSVVGEVAAHNLLLLAGYVLSGASMYLLVRYLGCARLVAVWAGMVYVVFPWHLGRTPHASLVHLEFFPLLLLTLVAAARRPSLGRLALVAAVILACWLTSGYFGAMAAVAAVAFAVGATVIRATRRRVRLVIGVAGASATATLFVAGLSAISGVGRGSGLQRVAGDLRVYGARPLELIVPSPGNLVAPHWLESFWNSRQHGSNFTETSNYVGWLTIALALVWIVLAWRGRHNLEARVRQATVGLVTVTVAAFLLSLPSPVTLFGHDVWAPSRLLWEVVPPFRVPSRWVVMVMAAMVPLAALALQAGWAKLEPRSRRVRGVPLAPVALVGLAMTASFLELASDPAASRFRADRPPAEYVALARTPFGVLAEYPLIENIDDLFWQRIHRRPVLNSSAFGFPPDEARRVVLDPETPGTASKLAFLGVTAIVTHRDALSYTDGVPDVPRPNWGPGYRMVARAPDGSSVWEVVARPAPALVTLHSGFGDPFRPQGNSIEFPLVSSSGVGYFEIRAREAGVLRFTFDAELPGRAKRVLRIADDQTEVPFTLNGRTHVSLNVEVPSGLSRLLVKTDPAATSIEDAIKLTPPVAVTGSGSPDLRAEAVSPDLGF